MSNTDHTKSGGKSGQRKGKQQRDQKLERQPRSLRPDQPQAARELSEAAVAAADTSPIGMAQPAETSPIGEAAPAKTSPIGEAAPAKTSPIGETTTAKTSPIGAAASADTSPVGLQTIATAYRDYTRKSFADAQSFVEKLSGARSIDKAFEVQSEFAKQAYETFMADSWRIRALYGELVRQTLKPPTGHRDR
jgi:Phasin protein